MIWGELFWLGGIPLAAFLHLLSMPMLFVVSFLTGFLTMLFDVSAMSYLPSLIERKDLIVGGALGVAQGLQWAMIVVIIGLQ